MKRRNDYILQAALEEKDVPDESESSITPRRRRNTIHEIPSPRAFETVVTEPKTPKRLKRAKSLFFQSQNDDPIQDTEQLAEPLTDSSDEHCTSLIHHSNNNCKSYQDISLQSQKPLIEPQPSTSKYSPFPHSPPANENLSFLRTGARTRGGFRRTPCIKVLKCQKVEIHKNKVKLTDLEENREDNVNQESCQREDVHDGKKTLTDKVENIVDNVDTKSLEPEVELDHSLQDSKIMDEMRNIFNVEEVKDNGSEIKARQSSNTIRTEEDLIRLLELDDDDCDEGSDEENVLEDCLSSDESEYDNIHYNETLGTTDEEWMSERDPTLASIEFEGYEKKLKFIPETNEPLDYFSMIATDEFFDMLVAKANNYASKLLSNILEPKSRLRLWKDVTVQEMKIFFGILFHMGTIKLNRVTDYWKKHPLFNLPIFSKSMSRNRFLLIMRSLNFEGDDMSDNKLRKINDLIRYFNQRMADIYCPSKNLAIDESMVLFRGRLIFRQYLKGKKHPYGIKLYILTDEYGVVMKIIVYAGASDTLMGGANHTEKVVMNLLSDYFNKGYSVYMDNFYNSINLAEKLLTLKTYCSGTLRANRKNNPKEVLQCKLKRGDSIAKFNKSGVCVMKWKDRRDVLMISTQFGSDMTNVTTRRGETVSKPEVVVQYNKYMGGIDHQDQMLAYYSCEHKTVRWYKKLGIHVFQQMLYNSFTLHNIFSTKKTFYDYRLEIIAKLLQIDLEDTTQNSIQRNQVHVLQQCSRKSNGIQRKVLRRRCRQCWLTSKVRKETSYFCPDCPKQYGFCLNNCFKTYHNY